MTIPERNLTLSREVAKIIIYKQKEVIIKKKLSIEANPEKYNKTKTLKTFLRLSALAWGKVSAGACASRCVFGIFY